MRELSPDAPARHLPQAGFSMVELLVVIALIVLLSALGTVAFNSIGKGGSVRGAVDAASSLALGARFEAMSHGLGAELAVDNGTNPETKLRRFAIFRVEPNATNSTISVTNLAGRPTMLPKGVYFLTPEISPGGYSAGYTSGSNIFSGTTPTPTLVFRFDGAGHLGASGRLVFAGGISGGSIVISDSMRAGMRGFQLPRNGRPMHFQTAEQIESASTP